MNAEAPQIPYNPEAEEAVIGALLIAPDLYYELAETLQAEDFYIHRHRWIWETAAQMHERRIPLDFLTLSDALECAGKLAEIGGPAYLTGLINSTPTSLHALAYARIVVENSVRRRLLAAASQVAKAAFREDAPIEQALNDAEQAVFKVAARHAGRDLTPAGEIVARVYDQVAGEAAAPGIPTGFCDLDRLLTGGQRPSDLTVVAGRPGMGKTGFVLSVVRHAVLEQGKCVALFSLEMDSDAMMMRLLAQESRVDLERIRTHRLRADDWPAYLAATERLEASRLFIDDTPALTPTQLRSRCRRLHLESGLDLVALDYLQLMSGGGRFENRTQEVAHISRSLKLIARELGVPLLAAAQLSRAVDQRNDKRPVLADLRESGAIEQDADVVLFLYRPEMYDEGGAKGQTKLSVAKQRNGPTGEVDLFFHAAQTRFDNAVRSHPA